MGMSASQARQIALLARMRDTEFEAQQINQQKVTLSNKMNEVQEALVNMEVPTPPSKIDYAIETYQGTVNGSKVKIQRNSRGQFAAYMKTSGVVTDCTTGSKGGTEKVFLGADVKSTVSAVAAGDKHYGVEQDKSKAQYVVDNVVYHNTDFVKYSPSQFLVKKEITSARATQIQQSISNWNDLSDEEKANHYFTEDDDNGNTIYYEWVQATGNTFDDNSEYKVKPGCEIDCKYSKGSELNNFNSQADERLNGTYFIKDSNGEYQAVDPKTITDSSVELFRYITKEAYDEEIAKNGTSQYEVFVADNNDSGETADLGTTIEGIYVVDGTKCRPLTTNDCYVKDGHFYLNDNTMKLKRQDDKGEAYTSTVISDNATVTSADGKKTGRVGDIPEDMSSDKTLQDAFLALQHSNPDFTEAELRDKFYLVSYGDGTFAFVMKEDYQQDDQDIFIFEVTNGQYFEEMKEGNYKIVYSTGTQGGIQGIQYAGTTYTVESVQEYKELEYDQAMAQYKYNKNVYDQEQNRLNKQTSIYQRQDKQLDLKLTRLDTERNALNTELEAVKKIIQDAIDKGFKTFNG